MPIEAALVKPVVDALLALFRQADALKLKRTADAALREVIRELLTANPDENRAAARIAIARAAGILSEEVVLAEDMLKKHRESRTRTRGKVATGRRRAAAVVDTAGTPSDAGAPADASAAAGAVPARPSPRRRVH